MAEDIIQFSPGEKVTAEETNENNLLLKEWALDNSASEAYIDGKIATLTNNLNGQISSINTQISSINSQISTKLSATTSKNASGYIKFSNGVIIQWGNFSNGTNTFPTAFTAYAKVAVSGEYSWNQKCYITSVHNTYFTVSDNTSPSQTPIKMYVAVGY